MNKKQKEVLYKMNYEIEQAQRKHEIVQSSFSRVKLLLKEAEMRGYIRGCNDGSSK